VSDVGPTASAFCRRARRAAAWPLLAFTPRAGARQADWKMLLAAGSHSPATSPSGTGRSSSPRSPTRRCWRNLASLFVTLAAWISGASVRARSSPRARRRAGGRGALVPRVFPLASGCSATARCGDRCVLCRLHLAVKELAIRGVGRSTSWRDHDPHRLFLLPAALASGETLVRKARRDAKLVASPGSRTAPAKASSRLLAGPFAGRVSSGSCFSSR